MIAIIDYDMGNLRSVQKAFEHIGAEATVTREAKVIANASHIVLPGVGAFKECMKNLEAYDLIDPILKATASGKPFLGICLGLQLLFEESEEHGFGETLKGLGIIKGRVKGFTPTPGKGLKVPHMGWNSIKKKKDSQLLKDIDDDSFFYFVHSYYALPTDEAVTLTTTDYGIDFTSSIESDNIMACQFHPEKSQDVGLKLLKNFKDLD
ncbi:MAG: imidazole glycerol phosphate synthase subunit HisH [Deltaproteobacteria bacterium]|nr:imidazole glycerol phosphate synthase subunit HisH [Deltaproteobacteria bacterium]